MKICVGNPVTPQLLSALRAAAPDAEIRTDAAFAREAEIVIGNPPLPVLRENPNLLLLQLRSAGTGEYPKLLKEKPALRLCCATGAYGRAVAEHMLASLLCLMKRLDGYARNQTRHEWADLGPASSIDGANVLVLGLGDIGSAFARMARALGAHVTGLRKSAAPQPDAADAVYGMDRLSELLPRADAIAMALPDTPETKHVINEERLALVKPGTYLVNAGRGSAIDQSALIKALKDGRLAGAALDVTETEPLPADDPMWRAPNLLITPHVAGGDHMDCIGTEIARIAAHNVKALVAGGAFLSLVDKNTGYRAR